LFVWLKPFFNVFSSPPAKAGGYSKRNGYINSPE